MTRCDLCLLVALAICFAQVTASLNDNVQGVSPVQKVIGLIDDFASKVKRDQNAGTQAFEAAARFCDKGAAEKDRAIRESNDELASLAASIENSKAKVAEHASNIEDASARISTTEGELYKATELRERAHKEFLANEKELLKTADELEASSSTLKKQMALSQVTPGAQKNLKRILAGLSQVVEASFVTHAQREKVRAFLQARSDAEDDLTLSASNQGDGVVVETIEQMNEKADGTLSDTRRAEMQAKHEYMMLKQGLESEIASTTSELNENTRAKKVQEESIAHAQKDLSVVKRGTSEDTSFLDELKRDCQAKARQFEEEHRDASDELNALSSARDILAPKFGAAFLQSRYTSGSKVTLRVADTHTDVGDDAKARALRAIEQLGKTYHSTTLVALSYRAAADPFDKIGTMIDDMIKKLEHEAAEAATQHAFCETEIGKSTASKAEKEEKLETANARIEKAESSLAVLAEQVSTLSQEIADIDASVKDAVLIRASENKAFRVAEKDFAESETACAQALEVLREYYEGASAAFVQTGAMSKSKVVEDTRGGAGIISLLELAESDFGRMLADTRSAEEASATEAEQLLADNKQNKATKDAERKGKESEMKTLKSALANSNEDKDGLSSELEAVVQYLAELKPQCETKAPSYAEVKAKREAEISGLKDALEILQSSA